MFSIPAFAINNSFENSLVIQVLVNFPNLYCLFPCRTNPCFFSSQMMNVNPNLNDSSNQQNSITYVIISVLIDEIFSMSNYHSLHF